MEMDDCVAELKKIHKQSQTELQNQLDEWRRKALKFEADNAQIKCRLEAAQALHPCVPRNPMVQSFERDSSVDSDRG